MRVEQIGDATLYLGDVRDSLREIEAGSVQCVVTSPPYWGLRDYGVDGQIGLEATPEEYVATMVDVFAEVRRVLRDDGTVWLNLGDSYASSGRSSRDESPGVGAKQAMPAPGRTLKWQAGGGHNFSWFIPSFGMQIKPKDIIGIPWRVAFALQADGWYLRQDIIWAKPNPMPESVTDRCTKAHEYIFLLSKSARYFYNAYAISEVCEAHNIGRKRGNDSEVETNAKTFMRTRSGLKNGNGRRYENRNKRSVWTVATAPYSAAHFATFPPALIEPCILAGSRPGDTVFDPFCGSGTTAGVALKHGRKAILCELSEEYGALMPDRIRSITDALDQPRLIEDKPEPVKQGKLT